MSRYALVTGGVVQTIAEGTPEWAAAVGAVPVPDGTAAGPGWTWDGSAFAAPPRALRDVQVEALAQIETARQLRIAEGASVGGITIPLALEDLIYWLAAQVNASALSYPLTVESGPGLDADVGSVAEADLPAAIQTILTTVLTHRGAALVARAAVRQATTVAEVDAALAAYLEGA